MGKTWSTFQTPPRWENLQNKPIWLSDNVANWEDIFDKPATFTPSAHTQDWGTITGKPTAFTPSAHTHTWANISDPPATYTPSAHNHGFMALGGSLIEFGENTVNYFDFHTQGIGKPSVDFDARIICLPATTSTINGSAALQYQAFNHFFYGWMFLYSLPTSGVGLPSGQLWRSGNQLMIA